MQVCVLEETMVKEPEKCRQVLQTARPLPSTLQVGHICRRNTRYRMAKQAIEEGLIGRVVVMSSGRSILQVRTHEIMHIARPVFGDSVHATGLVLWLTSDCNA